MCSLINCMCYFKTLRWDLKDGLEVEEGKVTGDIERSRVSIWSQSFFSVLPLKVSMKAGLGGGLQRCGKGFVYARTLLSQVFFIFHGFRGVGVGVGPYHPSTCEAEAGGFL